MERVTPDRVILTDGRVFPTPGGSAPRPGQRVIVDCRPGLMASTPGHTPRRHDDEGAPFIPPAPELDGWTRPVSIGGTAMTVPSADGPLLIGTMPTIPAQVGGGAALLSHLQGANVVRATESTPDFTYTLADGGVEVSIFPFNLYQRLLTGAFPTEVTAAGPDGEVGGTGEPLPDGSNSLAPSVYWRVSGEVGGLTGEHYLAVTHRSLETGERTTTYDVLAPAGKRVVLTLTARVWLAGWIVTDEGPSGGGPGYWSEDATLELVWLPVKFPDGRPGLSAFLHWFAPPDDEGRVFEHYMTVASAVGDGGVIVTDWDGRSVGGFGAGLRLANDFLFPPEEGDPRHIPNPRLLWRGWGVEPVPDSAPFDHSYDAQVPAGEVRLAAPPGTVSTGSHMDHPRDGAVLTLDGAALPCTSWAVLARREGDGPDEAGTPGLLTCDGTVLRAYWAADSPPVPADVTLLLGLRDERGDPLPAGSVTDALLESELAVWRHPDHVRLLYTLAGQRRAVILAPWNAWRDLNRAGWAKAKRSRPRTLKAWVALPRERWPAPPGHGLAPQGQITPPLLDQAGLPRYGLSPRVVQGPGTFGRRWPWGARPWLTLPDERAQPPAPQRVTAPVPTGWPAVAEPVVIVGRGRGDAPLRRVQGHWTVKRGGLRPFVLLRPALPTTLDLRGLRLEHLAAYRLRSEDET